MTDIPLDTLGLKEKWPRLAELQDEIGGLEKRQQEAVAEVQRLQAQLDPAREQDLNAEAEAIRSGKQAPEPANEKKVQAKLESAERNQRVLTRALEAARQDMAVLVAKHQRELFADVVAVRAKIAGKIAESAREALAGFGRYEDLRYTLKALTPPVEHDENAPPVQSSATLIGVHTTQSSGPDRGQIEQMLSYLIGLDEEGSKSNAA